MHSRFTPESFRSVLSEVHPLFIRFDSLKIIDWCAVFHQFIAIIKLDEIASSAVYMKKERQLTSWCQSRCVTYSTTFAVFEIEQIIQFICCQIILDSLLIADLAINS